MQWMSPVQYWNEKIPLWLKVFVWSGGAVCLIMGFSTLISLGILGSIDAILMLGLGYGIIWKHSRACAVAGAAYYALNQVVVRLLMPLPVQTSSLMSIGVYVMIGLLLLSVYGTFTVRARYDAYIEKQKLGHLDDEAKPLE